MTGGRFDFDDGGTYCGGWEDGKAHGHGICTGPKGQGEYAGSWAHGFEVVGTYTWPSGNTYHGYWAQGKRHGLGVETKGKWMYRGEWSHGFKGRYGVRQSLTSPARYEGTWSNGLQDGYGVETYGDGGTYQGQWTGGMRHGYGMRQSVPYGMATVIRSPLRTSLASLRSEQSNGTVLHDIAADSPAGTRGGFVLNFHSDPDSVGNGTKEEGKYKNNVLVRGIRKQLIPIRNTKTKEKVERALEGAQRAAAMARTKVEIATSRTAHARAKADAAEQASQSARQECDVARAVARELSPGFYQPGPDYIKQRFQEGGEIKEIPEEKAQENPPIPRESPHFYRKGTTPPGSPEESHKHSSASSAKPSPAEQGRKQNSTPENRLIHEKKNLISENIVQVVHKPVFSKAPAVKEEMMAKHHQKLSPRNNPKSKENGELHDHYHGYYVKTNPTLYPYELGEDEDHSNPSSSAAKPAASAQKPSPTRAGNQLDAKESLKKLESSAPKNPANSDFSSVENEISLGPNSIMIVMVMLLNIGLAILFVHFLT
ncbi:junctophilin-1 [Crotalus adamanteus]|uniref:Junctophilin-1 n=1 Tax=Crotalus adamanteus TaxID=8729 RepID=A0AAW1BN10_CROAD